MAVEAINTNSPALGAGLPQTKAADEDVLGKSDFLKLLVTQLQYQDPLNPADATEFTSQLAQFSSLEQMENVNSNLETLLLAQETTGNYMAINFIGKEVLTLGDNAELLNNEGKNLHYELKEPADSVVVTIMDSNGNIVRTFNQNSVDSGPNEVFFDGRDSSGNQLPDGTYRFEVLASGAEGATIDSVTYSQSTVHGIEYKNGIPYLMTDNGVFPVIDLYKVIGS